MAKRKKHRSVASADPNGLSQEKPKRLQVPSRKRKLTVKVENFVDNMLRKLGELDPDYAPHKYEVGRSGLLKLYSNVDESQLVEMEQSLNATIDARRQLNELMNLLSPTQRKILAAHIKGLSRKATALSLGRSERTVQQHISLIKEKTGLVMKELIGKILWLELQDNGLALLQTRENP